MRSLVLPLALWAWPLALAADPYEGGYTERQALAQAVQGLVDLQDTEALLAAAQHMMASLGLSLRPPEIPPVEDEPFVPTPGAKLEMVDLRLLLTLIAIQAGAKDHAALIRAQGEREHEFMLLRAGRVTLAEFLLLAQAGSAGAYVVETPDGVRLLRPLAIWDDAGLVLGSGETLELDRAEGSFVANLGWLAVPGGTIRSTPAINSGERPFRPFVLTAGAGHLTARGARFEGLGFGTATAFGGVAVVNSGLVESPYPSWIIDSTALGVATIALVDVAGPILAGNRVVDAVGRAVLLSNASRALVVDNHISTRSGAQAIRIAAGSSNVRVSGNVVAAGAAVGIVIDAGTEIEIAGNVVVGTTTSGIVVLSSGCPQIDGNLVAGNGGAGISLAGTEDGRIEHNAVLFNRGAGVLLRDQPAEATFWLDGNVLAGNRDGLRGATSGRVVLGNNRMDWQLPRLFAGDLSRMMLAWLNDRPEARTGNATAPAPPCRREVTD